MNINQDLRKICLLSIDDFEKKILIDNKKLLRKKIPLHNKIVREIKRIFRHFSKIKAVIVLIQHMKEKYDPVHRSRLAKAFSTSHEHQIILVLYQPHGVSENWKSAIEQLSNMDAGVNIVANAGLIEKDLILFNSYKNITVIERVNFGLDFGAYKDLTLSLLSQKNKNIEKLTLINDSFFFPIFGTVQELFRKIDKKPQDFIGLVENTGYDKNNDFHYGSFFLQIKKTILKHEDFMSFWNNFKPSNSKKETIKNGEIKISQVIKKNNFSLGVVFNYNDLYAKIKAMNSLELLEAIDDVVLCCTSEWRHYQNQYKNHLKDTYENSDCWKNYAIEWIHNTIELSNKTHTGAILYPKLLGMPILKKDLMTRFGDHTWKQIKNRLEPIIEIRL